MSKLQAFLDDMEDYELMALYEYRYDTFMKGSKRKIKDEIEKRKLDLDKPHDYIKNAKSQFTDEEINQSVCCPRCYSKKFYHKDEIDQIHTRHYSFEIENTFKTCMICFYSQDKAEYKKEKNNFWSRLKLLIKRP
tara:strand:- start:83344 stop:83748 length:405 start_codon:yes stop_codon:yes gene_type:complete